MRQLASGLKTGFAVRLPQFCAVNCRVFEGRQREDLQRLADELEAAFGRG